MNAALNSSKLIKRINSIIHKYIKQNDLREEKVKAQLQIQMRMASGIFIAGDFPLDFVAGDFSFGGFCRGGFSVRGILTREILSVTRPHRRNRDNESDGNARGFSFERHSNRDLIINPTLELYFFKKYYIVLFPRQYLSEIQRNYDFCSSH